MKSEKENEIELFVKEYEIETKFPVFGNGVRFAIKTLRFNFFNVVLNVLKALK